MFFAILGIYKACGLYNYKHYGSERRSKNTVSQRKNDTHGTCQRSRKNLGQKIYGTQSFPEISKQFYEI